MICDNKNTSTTSNSSKDLVKHCKKLKENLNGYLSNNTQKGSCEVSTQFKGLFVFLLYKKIKLFYSNIFDEFIGLVVVVVVAVVVIVSTFIVLYK